MTNLLLFVVLLSFGSSAFAYDDATFFVPPVTLSGIDNQLPDLIGTQGSQLCAPVALTHAFEFLKNHRRPNFPALNPIADVDGDGVQDTYKDRVRYFFTICNTDKQIGTRYRATIACMRQYMSHSVYEPWAYMIGPHAIEAPAGYPIESVQHVLNLNEIRYYVKNQAAVLMGIGWYKINPANGLYERAAGHFFNLYGYEHNTAWGEQQMNLSVVNSWMDYRTRPANQNFDRILIRKIQAANPASVPGETAFELVGEGFNFPDYRAFVEDIFVAFPGIKAAIPYSLLAQNQSPRLSLNQ